MIDLFPDGSLCTVNGRGDLMIDRTDGWWIGKECRIIKETKAGLIEIELVEDTRKRRSFAKYNIDLL